MNSLFTNLLSLQRIEYLIIDQELNILEKSLGVERLDTCEQAHKGQDIRLIFPELTGLEDIFQEILQGRRNNFKLKGMMRSAVNNSDAPVYIDICITNNIHNNYQSHELMILIEDVTNRMVLEQALTQATNEANLLLNKLSATNQYVNQIMESMVDVLMVTTLSGKIKKLNLSAQVLLEYSEAELIGQPICKFITGVDNLITKTGEIQKTSLTNIHQELNSPTISVPLIKEAESVCHTRTGKIIPVAFSCSMVQTEVEHFQGYVYIIRDITERKQAELAKREFIAMISHEIRTPITSVTGMASLLLNSELSIQQQDFVKTIYSSSNILLKIINDILDFSKIDSGKIEIETQPFNLIICLHEAINLLLPKAREKGLKLTLLELSDLPEMIVGDITRLRQVLVNLLNNAIKFTEVGDVEISVKVFKKQELKNAVEIQFAVRDTGIGIPSDRFERLFLAFSQVNASITRQYGGTGLGLAVCKQLCELMGGRIWVESQVNVGSKFYFTIVAPVFDEPGGNNADIANDTQINTRMAKQFPLRILLVEDHIINQRMIGLMLQGMGYQPDIVNNGLEALAALHRQLYDVVLMDIQMPQMDGLTATQHIYQEWTKETRPWIIALTASAMREVELEKQRYLSLGINDYLTKPIRIQELMTALKKCQPLVDSFKNQDMQTKEIEEQDTIKHPVDYAALDEILQMASFNPAINAREFILETIDYYLAETPKILQDIHTYLEQKKYANLRRCVHTLASTSATLGAGDLAILCRELEAILIQENFHDVANLIEKMQTEYHRVQIALQQEQKKYSYPL
ncbi:ATP-binding protein [Fortiea contorta]|uniref:ATP-binding protein n=1 Tax=Fortiea contorta TaxID=1892405 RepID=UPI00034969D8|nr:ATP-binding protein [Fortiea contorta]